MTSSTPGPAVERVDGDLRSSNHVEAAATVELDDTDLMLTRLLGAVRIA